MELFRRYFIDTVRNRYVDFKGRAGRREFWYFTLFYLIIAVILGIIDSLVFGSVSENGTPSAGVLGSIFSLALLLPSLGISIRRLHDIGKSGWWLLIGLVPLIGCIVLLIFYIKDSQPGTNQYGPNPKGI